MNFDIIDKIYFLHLSDRYDREKWMNQQIQKIGFPKDKVNIWWTCRRNISNEIYKNVVHDNLNIENYIDKDICQNPYLGGGVFNCAFEHYTIIRTSYERGFEHILIFEDDAEFFVNLDTFKYFISKLPDNYICCKFFNQTFTKNKKYNNIKYDLPYNLENIKEPYSLINNINKKNISYFKYCSTISYMLNREGMKKVIEIYNKNFLVADHIFRCLDYFYICNYKIVLPQGDNCNPQDYLWSDLWFLDTNKKFNQFR